jgi:ankyrin repeat protein
MSSNSSSQSSNDEEGDDLSNYYDEELSEEEEEDEWEPFSETDRELIEAIVTSNDATTVQHALQNGANVNCHSREFFATPLMLACRHGYDSIVRILLEAGADARSNNRAGWSVIHHAISRGHMSIVEMLLNHGNGHLESLDSDGCTPLLFAIHSEQFEIVHFLLDRGANALATTEDGSTALMRACQRGADLRLVRRLLSAGVPVDARDKYLCTALHYAANRGNIEATRVLIVEHNANMFAVDQAGETPFDYATCADSTDGQHALLECYGNKLTQEHGRLALHAILAAAAYSFIEEYDFHPPQNPLQIHAPLGELTLQHFRALLHSLDIESIRNRDATGKVPIHLACHANAPVEILSMLTEMDPTTLQIADHTGALPIHSLCGSGSPTEDASVQYLVEQGGVGTLAACNRNGAMPLHVLCGSKYPSLRIVQYLIQCFPGSVPTQTNSGEYPFMTAASETSEASLSVVYELVRASPNLIFPNT